MIIKHVTISSNVGIFVGKQQAFASRTIFYGVLGRWGIKPAIITHRSAVHRRNVFMVVPRG